MSELSEIKEMLSHQGKRIDDIYSYQAQQGKRIDDIYFSIYGNKDAGIKGIAKIVEAHDRYILNDKKIKWIGAGIASASGVGIWESIKHLLHL